MSDFVPRPLAFFVNDDATEYGTLITELGGYRLELLEDADTPYWVVLYVLDVFDDGEKIGDAASPEAAKRVARDHWVAKCKASLLVGSNS